jgi:Zn-dependent protease with chaperone function/AraC-like DNA-binding protein
VDFFTHQEQARRATWWLVGYFVMTVVAIIAIVYLAVVAGIAASSDRFDVPFQPLAWHPTILIYVVGAVLAVISAGSLYKIIELGGDGNRVAVHLGGKKVPPNSRELDERILLNVVEEMAIASGTPVPPVYLLENELGINAFAAGTSPQNAVIGITRGAIQTLSRDQLQGVIAHEFSHILNGDMRLNLRLIGLLHGILLIAMTGYLVLRIVWHMPTRSSNDDEKGTLAIIALASMIGAALVAIGYVGVFFANLIQAAVSRQREFLADASAVQFTRNPDGIASALKRIGGWKSKATIKSIDAKEASHMFFGQGVAAQWFATHPPLSLRIKRLDPQFDGKFPATSPVTHSESELIDPRSLAISRMSSDDSHTAALAGVEHFEMAPQDAIDHIGSPANEHLEHAHHLVEEIDTSLVDEVRDPLGAVATMYAMLLAPANDPLRRSQLATISKASDPRVLAEVHRIVDKVDQLEDEQRLPTACLALPALSQLSDRQSLSFRKLVKQLIEADYHWSFFEYAIHRFIDKRLANHATNLESGGSLTLAATQNAFGLILSTLAHLSSGEFGAARSFQAGLQAIQGSRLNIALSPREACNLKPFDSALGIIEKANLKARKQMLSAFCGCVAADGKATLREIELLRVVSDALGCPMPPILDLHKD